MSGICLGNVTKAFPEQPLKGKVQEDIQEAYKLGGRNPDELHKLPNFVGGETHLMIRIHYLKYYPERMFQLPNGLTICKSSFKNQDGSRGVPHRIFTEIEKQHVGGHLGIDQYCNEQVKLVKMGYKMNLDISLLGTKSEINDARSDSKKGNYHSRQENIKASKWLEKVEKAGTEILYRCANCRSCPNCKNSEKKRIYFNAGGSGEEYNRQKRPR